MEIKLTFVPIEIDGKIVGEQITFLPQEVEIKKVA